MKRYDILILLIVSLLIIFIPNKQHYIGDTKVIYTIFAGRDYNLDILTKYIDTLIEKGKIDEVHLWDFTRKDSDGEYLKQLEKKEKYTVMNVKNKKSWSEYYNFYKDPKFSNDVIIKSDDDIMYIDVDKFEDFINERKTSDAFLLFPSIVNNGVTSFHQQQDGLLPESVEKLEYETFMGKIVTNGKVGTKIHEYFVNNKDEFIKKARENNKIINIKSGDRTSINFFAIFGRDFNSLGEVGDDEHEITVVYPPKIGKHNKIYAGFVVVHGSFSSQTQNKDLDDKYIAKLYSQFV